MYNRLFNILFFFLSIITITGASGADWKYYYEKSREHQKNIHIGISNEKYIPDSSLYYIEKAVEQAKIEFGELDSNYTNSLGELAIIKTKQKKFDETLELFKTILELNTKIYNSNNEIMIRDLDNLGVAYFDLNLFDSTEKCWKESLEIRERIYDKNHPQMAIGINNIAYINRFQGKLRAATELYKEVIRIRRLNVLGDHFTLAAPLNSLGIVLVAQGYFDEAEKYYIEAIGIARRLNNYSDGYLASFLNNLGILYKKQKRYLDAELFLKESFEIKKEFMKNNSLQLSYSLNDLADLYMQIGSYKQAEDYFLKALKIRKEINHGDNANIATTLNDLAKLYLVTGNYTKAEPFFIEALEMQKRLFHSEHQRIAGNFYNLAVLYRKTGQFLKAKEMLDSALDMYKTLFKEKQQDFALCLRELGIIYTLEKKYSDAQRLFEETIDIQMKIYKKNNYETALTYFELGNLFKFTKDYLLAEKNYLNALEIMQSVFNTQSKYLSEKEKEIFWIKIKTSFDEFADFAINFSKSQNSFITIFNNLLFTKKIIFNSNIKIRNSIFNSKNDKLITDYERWIFITERLASLYSDYKNNSTNIDSLETEANELEKNLNLQSNDFSNLINEKHITTDDVKKALETNEYAIEIFKHSNGINKDDEKYFAIILSKDSIAGIVDIGNATDMDSNYIRYVDNIRLKVYDYDSYNCFWEKIGKKIQNAKKIYFSPDGVYNKINLSTLLNPNTQFFLFEELDIQIVNSTKDIVKNTNSIVFSNTNTVELFANPSLKINDVLVNSESEENVSRDFSNIKNDSRQIQSIERNKFKNLKYAEIEVESIGNIIHSKDSSIQINIYTNEKATERTVKSLYSPKILHIATHGQYFRNSSNQDSTNNTSAHLLNSALFFTGAENSIDNPYDKEGNINAEDGILYAYEARNIHLFGTELTVLSACESGLGDIKSGEGAYSMQRAFSIAGSNAVITSLWKVNDQTTKEFMEIFYANLFDGKSNFDAFKIACSKIKEKYDMPYYWGAFVLICNHL